MKDRRCRAATIHGMHGMAGAVAALLVVLLFVAQYGAYAEKKGERERTPDPQWLAIIRRSLETEEYRPSKAQVDIKGERLTEHVWHIINRAQGLRSRISGDGWELAPQRAKRGIDGEDVLRHSNEAEHGKGDPQWHWRYRLSYLARGDDRTRLASPGITADSDTVRLTYSPTVSEWYTNSRVGIEQGFEIRERPHAGSAGELVLAGEVQTDLVVESPTGERIGFYRNGVEVFQYSGLKVFDSTGKTLTSRLSYRMSQAKKQLLIHIDDAKAVYPVTVDPVASSSSWTGESDQSLSYYGLSVSSAGDVNGDGFSDMVVGAHYYDNGETDEGRAYLYLGSASGLKTTAAWTGESDQALAYYGVSVASAGDVNGDGFADVAVGAYHYSNGQSDEGRAYVYLGSASGLSATAAWMTESNQNFAYYGASVSGAGDSNGDGYSDLLVGAYGYSNGEVSEGRAYLYLGSASGLATTAAWTGESDQAYSYFGFSVNTVGDVNGDGYPDVAVGAHLFDNRETDEGRAFLYLGAASGLATTPAWIGESDQDAARYGSSIASAGDVNGDGYADVLIGAYLYDNGETNEGRTYLYHGSPSGLTTTAAWTGEPNQPFAYYGVSVSSAGDSNRDGYGDVVVGAFGLDNGQTNEGSAYLYHGSATGLETTASWTGESDQAGAYYGFSVCNAGDINGDGRSDVAVGAYLYDNGESNEGRAYLYLGVPNPTPTPPVVPTGGVEQIDLFRSQLPAPEITDFGPRKGVRIKVPFKVSYSSDFLKTVGAFLRRVLKRRVISESQVRAMLNKSLVYSFTLTPVRAVGITASSVGAEYSSLASRPKLTRVRSRRNQVTVARLISGQTYSATYQLRFEFKRYKRIFATKQSLPAVFQKQ